MDGCIKFRTFVCKNLKNWGEELGMSDSSRLPFVALLGPTASGKTHLAVALAARLGAEIVSADSRQLYRRMDIGTGKDLSEYEVAGRRIPYHLIDIFEPGEQSNLFAYQQRFYEVWDRLQAAGTPVILCGGSGMYAEAILRGYRLAEVAPNPELRKQLEERTDEELIGILASHQPLHNTTDTSSRKRLIRAVEIALSTREVEGEGRAGLQGVTFAISLPQEIRWKRISERLKTRLESGLVEEVDSLLKESISPAQLIYYGLEYKYVTQYLLGEITSRETLYEQLNIAIRQFSKRQMTYLRGMERRGITLHWLDGTRPPAELVREMEETLRGAN